MADSQARNVFTIPAIQASTDRKDAALSLEGI